MAGLKETTGLASARAKASRPGGATSRLMAGPSMTGPSMTGGEALPKKSRRGMDWKKVLLVAGLGILSWISTYTGMLELIQSNMGHLDFTIQIAIGMSVAMLMLMIIWLLDQLFSPIHWTTRVLFLAGYLFLTLISVGFSFGFYWKFLNSHTEASASAEAAVSNVQLSLHAAETRLSQLVSTFDTLTGVSTQKAQDEISTGKSCPNSKPGDGPRRRLREADAAQFAMAGKFVGSRIDGLKADITSLDADMALVVNNDVSTIDPKTGTRNEFLKSLSRKLDKTVTGFNAFRTDPQLKQLRGDFAARAEKTIFPDDHGGQFTCPDPQLQAALRSAVAALDGIPTLEKPEIAAVEGSEATIEAFRRLIVTAGSLAHFKMPPSPDELRDQQQKAVQAVQGGSIKVGGAQEVAGLGKNDFLPLIIALFVDFCLLLVSISRPMNRFTALTDRMHQAQDWPVIEILSKFHGIHQDQTIRQTFEVLRHVVFDWRGVYYAAIPLNGGAEEGSQPAGSPSLATKEGELEAYLLNNLFTSFERERIFKPVPISMFTTAYIQKKLKAQRSKYASVDAFRIYKFNDGAWPEMILGAIMGAAKRVEAYERLVAAEERQREADLRKTGAFDLPHADSEQFEADQPVAAVAAKSAKRDELKIAIDPQPSRGAKIEPVLDAISNETGAAMSAAAAKPQAEGDLVHILTHMTSLLEKLAVERQAAAAAPEPIVVNGHAGEMPIAAEAPVNGSQGRVYHRVEFGAAANAGDNSESAARLTSERLATERLKSSLASVLSLPVRAGNDADTQDASNRGRRLQERLNEVRLPMPSDELEADEPILDLSTVEYEEAEFVEDRPSLNKTLSRDQDVYAPSLPASTSEPDWNQQDIDFSSITKWYGRGRDKGTMNGGH